MAQPFDIDRETANYAIDAILNWHGKSMTHPNETLSNVIQRYPTYDK